MDKHAVDYVQIIWPVDRTKVFCSCGWHYQYLTGELDPIKVGEEHVRRATAGMEG